MACSTTHPIVLMYHGIVSPLSGPPKGRESGAVLYDVRLENFRFQMAYLKNNGYQTALPVPAGGGVGSAADKRVILTFDDGEMNNFEAALPVLLDMGFHAYFFIIAKRVGRAGYMGWGELKRLHEAGMTIGSHGFSHEILTNLQDTQIEEELRASKKYLECNLNIPVNSLSIPRGFCNDKIIKIVYEAGYTEVFISERPASLRSPCLSRISVKDNWTLKRFERALAGRRPVGEKIFDACKNGVKTVCGGPFYDGLRRVLLKIK